MLTSAAQITCHIIKEYINWNMDVQVLTNAWLEKNHFASHNEQKQVWAATNLFPVKRFNWIQQKH